MAGEAFYTLRVTLLSYLDSSFCRKGSENLISRFIDLQRAHHRKLQLSGLTGQEKRRQKCCRDKSITYRRTSAPPRCQAAAPWFCSKDNSRQSLSVVCPGFTVIYQWDSGLLGKKRDKREEYPRPSQPDTHFAPSQTFANKRSHGLRSVDH